MPRRPRTPNVRRLPSGRYQATFTDPTGRTRAIGTFDTEQQAKDARDAHRGAVVTGTYVAPDQGAELLSEYAARWLKRKSTTLKPSTISGYERLIRVFINGNVDGLILGKMPLRAITPTMVADWHARVQSTTARSPVPPPTKALSPEQAARRWLTAQGYEVNRRGGRLSAELMDTWRRAGSPTPAPRNPEPHRLDGPSRGASQTAHAYRCLRTIMSDANREGLLPQGQPCVLRGAGQERPAERPLITLDDVRALAAAMPASLAMFVNLAAASGLRRGELLALRRDAITFIRRDGRIVGCRIAVRENTVQVDGQWITGTTKSAAGRRSVPIDSLTAQALSDHLANYVDPAIDALVFTNSKGTTVDERTLQRAWNRARKQCRLDRLRLHDLRHFAATEWRRSGAALPELMRLLGHTDLKAVQIYQHVDDDDLDRIAERLSERRATALAGLVGGSRSRTK